MIISGMWRVEGRHVTTAALESDVGSKPPGEHVEVHGAETFHRQCCTSTTAGVARA
jgi:hypothetical protein